MLGWAIKLLLVFFVLRAISRLFRGIAEGMRPPRVEPPPAVPLARDPVCGTFVVPSRAIVAGTGAAMRFFCSENCRRAYEMTPAPHANAGGKPPQAAKG
jgi:YHS domain-containing protein